MKIKNEVVKEKITGLLMIAGIILGLFSVKELYTVYKNHTVGIVDMLSVSTDGRYVISTDEKEHATLWDLQNKSRKILSTNAHIFSAYFIPNSHNFLWQDQKKIIHIQNVDGSTIRTIPAKFFINGITMTRDYYHWMAGSIEGNLYTCVDDQCQVHCTENSKHDDFCGETPDELSAPKPCNLSITLDEKTIVSANFEQIIQWNTDDWQLIRDYNDNIFKTFVTFSPDGKYILSGDENSKQYVWDAQTGHKLVSIKFNQPNLDFNPAYAALNSKRIPQPADFNYSGILALKFIDANHYLAFDTGTHYAVLYETLIPQPLKFLDLNKYPRPAMEDYARNQAIDTSPNAHVLVMAKENHSGIFVYHYDPIKQTLTKVWDAMW